MRINTYINYILINHYYATAFLIGRWRDHSYVCTKRAKNGSAARLDGSSFPVFTGRAERGGNAYNESGRRTMGIIA